ncbi:MAG: hypothetical protein JWM36_1902 [Hyphomicrobiales bacterium]|nr:hypothetical protein [Hyphomicrobiales bacterium]
MSEAPRSSPPDRVFDPEGIIQVVAPALGLTIRDEYRPGVLAFLGVAQAMSKLVFAVPLHEDSMEMAAVFSAGAAMPGGEP